MDSIGESVDSAAADADGTWRVLGPLDKVMHIAMAVKEATARQAVAGASGDIAPIVVFERGGRAVAVVISPMIDRDYAIRAARIGTPGFAADGVSMCLDAHFARQSCSPSGPWTVGEMQAACDFEDACSVGTLTDCIVLIRGERNGTKVVLHSAVVPYHTTKGSPEVLWRDSPEVGGEKHFDGALPEALLRALSSTTVEELLIRARPHMERADARAAAVSATVETLRKAGYSVWTSEQTTIALINEGDV